MKTLLSLLLSFVLACGCGAYAQKTKRVALVVGNSNYKHSVSLQSTSNDATGMSQALKEIGFEVTTLLDADLVTMKKNITVFTDHKKNGKADIALFYYAGHGIQYHNKNYVVPTDAKLTFETLVETECLSLDYLMDSMRDMDNEKTVVIFDASSNNPFSRGRSVARSGNNESKFGTEGNNEMIVAFASSPNEVAIDEQRNGLFTEVLLKHIKKLDLPFEDVLKLTRKEVVELSNGMQTPWEISSCTTPTYLSGFKQRKNDIPIKDKVVTLLESTHPKRLALVIGNNDYLNNSSLANAKNDATDMKKKLEEELGFEVMYYTNLKKTELEKAVYDFGAKLTKYDAGLVFYAGHGIEYKEENYLIPVDAKLQFETLVKNECVDVSLIINNMEGARSKVNVIMLDACRDNPFVRSWKSAGRNIQNDGFVEIKAEDSQSLVVMFATSRGQTASDGENCNGNKRNGLFTGQLLPNLQKGVRIEDVFKRTKKAVRECSEGKQIPWNLNSLEGDFVF